MDKTLQTTAWSCLPKEFKEEVRKEYRQLHHKGYLRGRLRMLRELFGEHNLTSDAEGEEMLMVPRKKVQEMFAANERSKSAFAGTEIASESEQINHVLFSFFGSKCLPDVPSKLQASCRQVKEPNGTIDDTKGPDYSNATKIGKDCNDDSAHHFADAGKMVDHIADVRNMIPARLHIAAMAMQGMLSNPEFGKKYLGYLHCCHKGDDVIDETVYYAQKALIFADTLIAEAESHTSEIPKQ